MDLTKENYAIFILQKELETIKKRLDGDVIVDLRFKKEIEADKIKVKQLKRSIEVISSRVDWAKLRDKFFNECTTETPREEFGKKVNMSPHDLFEWFKREISEYVG